MGALLPSQHNPGMTPVKTVCAVAALATLASCSPALNWRELRLQEGELVAMFPCKPDHMSRTVPLAGGTVRMQLSSCTVDKVTFAVSHALLAQPLDVDMALNELRQAAGANIGGSPTRMTMLAVPGMTPNARAERLSLSGRHPDGSMVQEQVGFFVKGLRVYQATIVGPRIDADAADAFFGGLRLPN